MRKIFSSILSSWVFLIPAENPISFIERKLMVATDPPLAHVTDLTVLSQMPLENFDLDFSIKLSFKRLTV